MQWSKHAQQAVGVRGQVEAHHVRLLVGHVVQEAGVLVGEAVVVLLPHVGGEDIVQGGDVLPPGQLPLQAFSHLACWATMESTMRMNAS